MDTTITHTEGPGKHRRRIIILPRLTTIYIQFGGDHINITEEELNLLGRFFAIPDNSLIYAALLPQIDRKQGDADGG